MYNQINDAELVREDLAGAAARMTGVSSEGIFPYGELSEFLEEFLKMLCGPTCTLVCAGLVTPEIAVATDRAGVKLREIPGESPFTIDPQTVSSRVESPHDVIYVANPNRVSGACLTVKSLAHLVEAVPQGYLIVDESLFDYCSITALSLLEDYQNVIILRSFTTPFGIHSSGAGFGIAGKRLVATMKAAIHLGSVSRAIRQAIVTAIESGRAAVLRRQEIHDESLRIAVALTHLGVQCRLSATDFLLVRVASPKDAGNFLVANKVPVENLDGYPGMRNYLRYRLSSRESNDRLLESFKKMPGHFVRIPGFDRRAVSLHRRKASGGEPGGKRRYVSGPLPDRVSRRNASTVGADK